MSAQPNAESVPGFPVGLAQEAIDRLRQNPNEKSALLLLMVLSRGPTLMGTELYTQRPLIIYANSRD